MRRLGAPRRCAALDVTFGSFGAIGVLILAGCLVSAFSRPATPPSPEVAGLAEVTAALDTLENARWAFVEAMERGSMPDLRRIAASRERAMDRLSMDVENTTMLGALDWPHRLRWLELTLTERREDWGRPLLAAWASTLPKTGDVTRGPAALALGLVALALADEDPEEGSAYLAGPPTRSLDAVVEENLKAAAQEGFPMRDEALLRLASLAESDGDTTAALAWANALLLANPEGPHAPTARAIRARSLYGSGQFTQAIGEARQGIADDATAELRWILARALAAAGRGREAVAELDALIIAKPSDPLAIDALQMRRELDMAPAHIPLDTSTEISLLTALLANADAGAEEELGRIEARPELSSQAKDDVSLALARYLYRNKRYTDLLPRVQTLAGSGNGNVRAEARLLEARVYRNTSRLPAMEKAYRSLMTTRGDAGATAAWELAKEWESQSRWSDAAKTYTDLITGFPQSDRKRDATFRRGFSRLMQGKKSHALADFRNAQRLSRTPGEKEQAAFWIARTLWTTGHRRDAILVARRAARMPEPADAYGVLLRERFAVPEYPRDPSEDVNYFRAVRRTQALTASFDYPYQRGIARLELGLYKAAGKELRTAVLRHRPSRDELVQLSLAASAYGLYPEAVDWAKQAIEATAPSDPHRVALRRLAYPAAHAGYVVTEANKYEIDPAWIWALMRQESFYNPNAVSRKGAMGLMQVMPTTLAQMTAERGMAPLQPDALLRPNTNIAFGTRFFAERLDEFDRKLPPTLASYNAGEAKSLEWIERAKGDGEAVFMESIGYPETYDYVRRILWNIWLYHRLYAEESAIG
jgi:soluble lytic murein transglycosylase-like protein